MNRKPSTRGGRRIAGPGKRMGRPRREATATLSVRVSAAHKARFCASVPAKARRAWVEARIDAL